MSTTTVIETRKASGAEPVLGKQVRYVAAGHVPQTSPHNFHLPALTDFGDERFLPLHSVRPLPKVSELSQYVDHAQLHTHGFTAVHHPTPFHASSYNSQSFKDPQLLRQYLIPHTAEMMKQITGCKTVITESFLLRTSTWTEKDSLATHGEEVDEASELETGFPQFIGFNPKYGGASPASKIHLDFSPNGARTHIRKFHPDLAKSATDIIQHEDSLLKDGKDLKESYKDCGGPRWALYSIWRPLKIVDRDPLAVIGQGSFSKEDCVPVDIYFPCLGMGTNERHLSESLVIRYSENHKWHWIDKQTPEEVLILRFFDSDAEGGFVAGGGSFHSSLELPGTENEAPRESLEIRCLCIW
ncbi:GA4 desaturase [Annulohypoxylon truncatum]|uniref:GA4 desaturase n=1 Tax=Annulohypoxylon truncatum TaxID=327061 RepID=UPI0020088AE5|nr:GA4 desaturase [Annulohypoxylon truncatum]KAI1211997.1 GA4 desaturase [Annulohypoxylon truncatum]